MPDNYPDVDDNQEEQCFRMGRGTSIREEAQYKVIMLRNCWMQDLLMNTHTQSKLNISIHTKKQTLIERRWLNNTVLENCN